MTILTKLLRRQLESAIKQAREIAEGAAHEAIARMGVAESEAPTHLSDDNKALRRRLRAHARTLGDTRDAAGAMSVLRLQDAASYEIWHRMLFGRFLAERGLLIHPELGAAMSVAELRDLAKEEGAADEWALAERYAAPSLPGVFKPNDPVLALPIAPEFSKRLRSVLSSLPEEVFTADDSLGWTYQFWRASEKDAVNAGGGKIGAAELPAVTQLFTESYMVKFLLHNTLGAWWAGKVLAHDPELARHAAEEQALREACVIPGVTWDFLRFVRDDDGKGPWRPAAGTFPSWPLRAAEITYCDPCCGSGHFLVEAFGILAALRQREEGLSAADAVIGTLNDNLYGLELDGRCVQIAAFNVALAAWKFAKLPITLPLPHIAWVGAPPPMSRVEMSALADGDPLLQGALETLHDQFQQAPLLGSLLKIGAQDLLSDALRQRGDAAFAKLRGAEAEQAEGAVAARGLLDASELLMRRYVLLMTNVPFLGSKKQTPALAGHLARHFASAKADLATAMLERMRGMSVAGGTVASVTPQNWCFLGAYADLRRDILNSTALAMLVGLGSRAFETISGEVVNAALVVFSVMKPGQETSFSGLDCNLAADAQIKAHALRNADFQTLNQAGQQQNPDARLTVVDTEIGDLLSKYAFSMRGIVSGDGEKWIRKFWECNHFGSKWRRLQSTPEKTGLISGKEHVIDWEEHGSKMLRPGTQNEAYGKIGVAVGQMGSLPATLYYGDLYDNNTGVLCPNDQTQVAALWSYCSSDEFSRQVRRIDRKMNVTNATLVKVRFDLARWQSVAADRYPSGLPDPYSDDPTQWLFHGHPAFAQNGTELHVALARIAGYRWPGESDSKIQLSEAGRQKIALSAALPGAAIDGLLPLHASGTDLSLADRLRSFLGDAYGVPLSLAQEQALVRTADTLLDKKESRDVTLEGWLSNRAFRQHCILFHQRPFLWQVWDGLNDGFSAFLQYHRLDRATLDKLTYTLLGDWIRTVKADAYTAKLERAQQLQQKLAKIIEGESPYDIFVRWKPLARQPFGWDPDLDDGVRLNMRPFMTAGVLREQPKGISWNKDRGTDVPSAPWYDLGPSRGGNPGDRINDYHTTLAEKRSARSNG